MISKNQKMKIVFLQQKPLKLFYFYLHILITAVQGSKTKFTLVPKLSLQ